ncbi:MAG TPA: YfdX family protein [Sedimenticola thiotaurini]|uniref:YfdX family protein n=1 Tax=Sedimenticola thiotaurini TaxID=1543721 RepID=A0A831RLH6_9GAMM|nr:YfdX family protein [Sedimenticola thiotaurini]
MNRLARKLLPLAISLVLGTAAAGVAATPKPAAGLQESVTIEPGRTISPHQADIISRSAAKVLVHIAEARSAIQAKDRTRADKALGEARALLEIIRAESPTSKVIDHITVARKHLDYKETETVEADLVPIYADLMEIEDLVPVQSARQKLEQAGKALKKGDKKAATTALSAVQNALIYTELDLPVHSTERHVISAQQKLVDGHFAQADRELDAAEAGVVYLSIDVVSPLAQARRGLYLARQDYAARHYGEVKRDLASARRWLERAASGADKATVAAANDLKRQIDDITARLGKADKGLEKPIEGAWRKAQAMAEREAEKASIGWAGKRPDSDIRADLIDAKQHVAFAENMQFYAESDPADIFQTLDRAKAELDRVAAAGTLDAKGRQELEQAQKELASIRQDPKRHNLYDIVRSRLRGLIHHNF